MGFYLNSKTAYYMYKRETEKPFFIDKTKMLEELFPMVDGGNNFICITRPRRFGKTMAASMIGAFFTQGYNGDDVFGSLNISNSPEYQRHINKGNVIYIDFSAVGDECDSYEKYITNIKVLLREDLHRQYPDVDFRISEGSVSEDLTRINLETGETFIFILDEWDAIFHMPFVAEEDKKKYLLFLKSLLKGNAYVSLAYMTGILPIAKYSSGSERNMFWEYSMATQAKYSEYFGFTEKEVDI